LGKERKFLTRILLILGLAWVAGCQGTVELPPTASYIPDTALPSPTDTQPAVITTTSPTANPTAISPTPSPHPSTTPAAAFQMCSPLERESIPELWEIVSDPYNPPPEGRDERHQGVDFSHYRRKGYLTIEGEGVQAILPGRVALSIHNRMPYGNVVIIETRYDALPDTFTTQLGINPDQSLYLLYAHFEQAPLVNAEDMVACGQPLGTVGMVGYYLFNPHLHLETRIGPEGAVFGSMAFYDTSATQAEQMSYQRWRTSGEFVHFDPMILFQVYLDNLQELP
jgi:murein DD-endopeptidase MepM/ murein hydrolase activator NlpD